ncbi:hypothetical protein A7318_09090 [Pseudomonas lurida]|uniref:hypothetical protein n=1 Tax=Pseudomonas lurida TaxID=244566 RepID=UPI00083CBE78|nr:hypothetical protein [Pseudomonas lurida]AOE78726.1 hypothetical protein A7318_09090 [Pseudomonas lurida]
MSISQQIEDAKFLIESGRHLGALTLIILAIAGSSRKTLPQGTLSLKNLKKNGEPELMRDAEAFILFLGGRLKKEMFGVRSSVDYGGPAFGIRYKDKDVDLGECLYKYYRCSLIHESELPTGVDFVESLGGDYQGPTIVNQHGSMAISHGNHLVLDHGWLNLLINVVTGARCNAAEFGIDLIELVTIEGIDEDELRERLIAKYGIPTRTPFYACKEFVSRITPSVVKEATDLELAKIIKGLGADGVVPAVIFNSLIYRGLCGDFFDMSPVAIAFTKDIAECYEYKKW